MNMLDTLAIGRPITRGPISLYPIHATTPARTPYVPGPTAAIRGDLRIDELDGGDVPTLEVTNRAAAPVLLIEGETFCGGLQNRVLNVSVLLGIGKTPVPVSCVQANRWADGGEMRLSDRRAPRRLRRAKNQSVQQSMRTDGSRYSDQGEVWNAVDATLTARNIESASADLHSAFDALDGMMIDGTSRDSGAVSARAVAELTRLGPLPGQTGVVVAAGGRCLAADLFDDADTLAAYWNQIVTSHAFDLPTKTAQPPSLDRALRFVRRVRRGEHVKSAGVGIGTEHHWQSDRIIANGLEWNDAFLHLSIVAA